MSKNPNITFFLGAGASYFACPIWKEQGEKMVELATTYFNNTAEDFLELADSSLSKNDQVIWDVGYFGSKALKFGTIDTYAKMLNLNSSHDELARLKLSVSIFFTIWQLSDDKILKSFKNRKIDTIDRRFINLMAAILENSTDTKIKLKNNIRFVTWNYDLQIEFAFKAFHDDNLSWKDISQNLSFRNDKNTNKPLEVCHLNGYHGFYQTKSQEHHVLDRTSSTQIKDILNGLSFLITEQSHGQLNVTNHINYAWEGNPLADKTREEAKIVFSETDILIIVGYSFPNFNKEIDSQLFQQLKGRQTTIYYQDPNASESFIAQLVDTDNCKIICETKKMDNFYLPYEF